MVNNKANTTAEDTTAEDEKDSSANIGETQVKEGPKRKLRVLSGKRAFKRCKRCRSVNPILATVCLNCGNVLDNPSQSDSSE